MISRAKSEPCPDPGDLAAFALGQLAWSQFERIAQHLDDCPACAQSLERQSAVGDPLLQALASGPAQNPFEHLEGYQSGLAACERLAEETLGTGSFDGQLPTPNLPYRIGKYQLLEELGHGGMARVYRAVHNTLQNEVAVKLFSTKQSRNPSALRRFEREMKVIGRLKHPNVVAAIDAGAIQGQHFLVLEYVRGLNFEQLVRWLGPLSIGAATEAIRQAALGLDHAHRLGIVHRDIKPSNLMLDDTGTVKLTDFGLAQLKPLSEETGITGAEQIMGTVDYIAPEQIVNASAVDSRADIYSLGLHALLPVDCRDSHRRGRCGDDLREAPCAPRAPGPQSKRGQGRRASGTRATMAAHGRERPGRSLPNAG